MEFSILSRRGARFLLRTLRNSTQHYCVVKRTRKRSIRLDDASKWSCTRENGRSSRIVLSAMAWPTYIAHPNKSTRKWTGLSRFTLLTARNVFRLTYRRLGCTIGLRRYILFRTETGELRGRSPLLYSYGQACFRSLSQETASPTTSRLWSERIGATWGPWSHSLPSHNAPSLERPPPLLRTSLLNKTMSKRCWTVYRLSPKRRGSSGSGASARSLAMRMHSKRTFAIDWSTCAPRSLPLCSV